VCFWKVIVSDMHIIEQFARDGLLRVTYLGRLQITVEGPLVRNTCHILTPCNDD